MDIESPVLSDERYQGLADLVEIYRDSLDTLLDIQEDILAAFPPRVLAKTGTPLDSEGRAARARESLAELEAAVTNRDMGPYLEQSRKAVGQMADAGVAYDLIAHGVVAMLEPLGERALSAFPDDPGRGVEAREALGWLKSELLIVAGQAYANVRESSVEDEYQKVIRRLSTPVVQIWEEILVMPLIGVIDSGRARQILEQLLGRIVDSQSRIVIIDVTGVPTVDTEVADHLVRTTGAARLVGASTILVGISPQVAQTLVRLGASLTGIETRSDLRSGLELAFSMLGYKVVASG